MMPTNAQGPVQPPTTRRPTLDARQTAFLRRLRKNLHPASDFQFAWDPKNNPEQRRLRRAALIAGGVGLGAAALGVLGHRRGWFKPTPFTPRPSLSFTPPATPAPKVVPASAPAPAATVGSPQAIPHPVPAPAPVPVPSGNPPKKNAAASAELGKLVAKMKVKAGPSKPAPPPAPSPVAAGKGSTSGPAGGLPSSAAGHLAALHHAAQHGPNAGARRAAADTLKKLKEKRGIVHAVPVAAKKPKARIAPDPYRKPNRIIEDVGDRPGGRAPRHGSVTEETERQMAARFRALLLDRGDQARRLLWPDPPRWWKGRVPAMPPRGSVPAKRLAEDLRWAYRYRNAKGAGSGEIYGKIGTENARKAILRGGVTETPSSPGTTWLDPARPQQLRLLLHEDARDRIEFFAERIKKVAAVAVPAAVEMLPGGTAINAAGLAGLRTAIAFRRLKRARFGEGFAGYSRAALEPGSVAGMLGQASQTGVRDSRAFLKRVVRKLPEPAQVLNKKLFEAPAVDILPGGMSLFAFRSLDDPPRREGSVDRWLRRGAYLAAPVAAAGSVASVLALRRHANRLVPRVESGIASIEGAARAVHGAADHLVPHVENATAAIGGAARSIQAASGTVQDVAGRLPFLRKAPKSAPGSLAKALVRGHSIGGKIPRTFLEKLHDAWAGNRPIGQTFETRFAAEPIPAALLRARQKADRERVRKLELAHYRLFRMGTLLPAIEFGGREQMKDIHDNTWANPAAAAMGTQQVYIHKDRDGNPVPMKVTLRHAQVGRYLWNRAAKAERPLRRGYGLVRDVKDVVAGNPRRTDSRGRPRPREWDKAWFKRGLTIAGATAVGLGGLAYMKHFPSQGPGLPGKVKVPFTKKSVPVGDALPPKVRDARLPSRDAILGQVEKLKDKVNQYTPDFFPKRREFRARLRRILLDYSGADWDVRDARGRSARVFAGGSYPRARREKYWWEKAHNQRVMAAVAAPALLAAGFTGGRLLKDRPLKSLNPFRNPFAMSPPGADGNVVRNTPPPVRRATTP